MNRGLIVLLLAGACGLGTMFFAKSALNTGGAAPVDPEIDVVVAAKDIKPGAYLNDKPGGEPLIKLVKMKKSTVSPDFYSGGQVDLVSLTDEKTKRWVKYTIMAGEAINKKKLGDPKSRPGMAPEIQTGMRAITIRVDAESGVAGFVNPNDRVDVIVNYPDSRTAKILLQNVRVLAAGEHLNPDPDKSHLNVNTMSLELSMEDANKLRVASSRRGKLSLMLRGFNDDQIIPKEKEEMTFGESVEEREALRQKYDDMDKKLNLLLAERIEKDIDSSTTRLVSAPSVSLPTAPPAAAPQTSPQKSRSTSMVLGMSKFKVVGDGESGGAGKPNDPRFRNQMNGAGSDPGLDPAPPVNSAPVGGPRSN